MTMVIVCLSTADRGDQLAGCSVPGPADPHRSAPGLSGAEGEDPETATHVRGRVQTHESASAPSGAQVCTPPAFH